MKRKISSRKEKPGTGRKKAAGRKALYKEMWIHRELYFFILPAFVALIVFSYVPMYGVLMGFQDVKIGNPILQNEWVGLKHFVRFFKGAWFSDIMKNTVVTSLTCQLATWGVSVFLALLLHNTNSPRLKKTSQTLSYIPHLMSTVVVVSIINVFCAGDSGLINILLRNLGLDTINFFGSRQWVLPLYLISEIWVSCGYGAIIYLGTLNSIDEEIMEAAKIDGAGKLKRIRYIQLLLLTSTMAVMLIMKMGNVMTLGAEKMLLLQTDLNIRSSEVISTYVYKTGVAGGQFGFATAVGVFQSVTNLILVLLTNWVCKKLTDTSII